jgi:hypothetical protein
MNDVMKHLSDAVKWEDDFILKYDTDEVWTLIHEAVPAEKFWAIKKLLSENIIDTLMHKQLLMKLIRSGTSDI